MGKIFPQYSLARFFTNFLLSCFGPRKSACAEKQLQKNKKQYYKKILKTIFRTSAIARIQRKVKHIDFNTAVDIADALYARLTYGKTHATLQIHLY